TNSRLPQLKVIKTFVGDQNGLVDLKIDSTTYNNEIGRASCRESGNGFVNVGTGTHSVSELAHSSATDLANYDKAISCSNGDTATGQTSLTTSSHASGDKVTCTITNSRLPQLKVIKTFVGDQNGLVDLKIDSTTYNN